MAVKQNHLGKGMGKEIYHNPLKKLELICFDLEKLKMLAEAGFTDKKIYTLLKIPRDTWYDWCKKEPRIKQELDKAKAIADQMVQGSLFQNAVGFTRTIKKQVVTRSGEVVDIEEEIYIKPDTTAQIFWLKNRMHAEWRDRKDVDITTAGESLKAPRLGVITQEEADKIIEMTAKELGDGVNYPDVLGSEGGPGT